MDYEMALEVEKVLQNIKLGIANDEEISFLEEAITPIIENEKDKKFKSDRKFKIFFNNYNPVSEIHKAVQALSNGKNYYTHANDEIRHYEKETQDILHALELVKLEPEEEDELVERLKEVRQHRRTAKNFTELVKPIHDFADKNVQFMKQLNVICSEVQKIQKTLESRKYTPRVITALEEAFGRATAEKETSNG